MLNLEIKPNHRFFTLSHDVQGLSQPLSSYLGVSYFAFKRTFSDGSKIYLFNNPYYYEHYFNKKYFLIGNREGSISQYKNGYDLWDYLPDSYKLYNEASDCFNISHGLTVTRKHENHCDFFFFASNRENPLVKKLYLNKRELFENFCDYFLDSGKKIINSAQSSKVVLPYKNENLLDAKEFKVEEFLKNISKIKKDWTALTHRELDCAHQLILGKTNKEIASLLNISVRTVEEHIDNIKRKMQCKNKAELIAILCKGAVGVFTTS